MPIRIDTVASGLPVKPGESGEANGPVKPGA
jgi:hypothetical protein